MFKKLIQGKPNCSYCHNCQVDKKIVPKRYFIKPTGGKHPFAEYHERLNTGDFPYIIDTNWKNCRIKIFQIFSPKCIYFSQTSLKNLKTTNP